jgi:hypothetical protein
MVRISLLQYREPYAHVSIRSGPRTVVSRPSLMSSFSKLVEAVRSRLRRPAMCCATRNMPRSTCGVTAGRGGHQGTRCLSRLNRVSAWVLGVERPHLA